MIMHIPNSQLRNVTLPLLHQTAICDIIIKVYHKWSNPEIRPLLIMAYQFINARQCYYNFTCNRTKPYFEKQ